MKRKKIKIMLLVTTLLLIIGADLKYRIYMCHIVKYFSNSKYCAYFIRIQDYHCEIKELKISNNDVIRSLGN